MTQERRISVIIPNYNKSSTIGLCLDAVYASSYKNFEVVVVDDCSSDDSVEIIKKFPCKLVQMEKRGGASKARNEGAEHSCGEVLFFIDADCLLQSDALAISNEKVQGSKVFGGTYTKIPYDGRNFYSTFQSIYVNYAETKMKNADYLAGHCLVIDVKLFRESGGFAENPPIGVEDVEFSHRLRDAGYELRIYPELLVRHIFNFSFLGSLRNAAKRSTGWTIYSIRRGDMTRDSGAASIELKANVVLYFASLISALAYVLSGSGIFVLSIFIAAALNLFVSRRLIAAFNGAKGKKFTIVAAAYYTLIYPAAVGAGVIAGVMMYALNEGYE